MYRSSSKRTLSSVLRIVLVAIIVAAATPAVCLEKVIVFHAGSLSVPLERIEKDFEAANPQIDIERKAGGSTKMARLIADEGQPADIMASADYKVIDKTLIPAKADWNIRFATNQLVLCYTEKSRYADQINADNWYEILQKKEVIWGHSDPNQDPAGYRSLMVLQLAEKFYRRPGLFDRLIANRPEENVRPKAIELVTLINDGKMDYIWEYLSVAIQHHLKYVSLDDHINLGNYQFDDFYKQAQVKVTGQKPGEWITRSGQSITYGITLIKNAPNPAGAIRFLEYLLSPDGGLKVLKEMGQPPFVPCRIPTQAVKEMLPGSLPKLVEVHDH
jgi:molybdate/tungstate transport system substrate-binding protein